MIDAHLIRNEFETVRQRMLRRGPAAGELLDRLDVVERQRRELLPRVEALKHERKRDGELVAERKRSGGAVDDLLQANKRRAEDITALDRELAEVETTREDMLLRLPNLPHESVPQGTSAADNVEVRRVGTPTAMAFAPKPHWDLGTELGIIDFERAARMSGARFAVLMGAGARMARALIDFMLDLHTREHGYVEVEPPFLVGPHALVGTGNLPKFEDDLFRIAGDRQLYLIPTAEVPLTNLHREEILDGARLPIRYTAYTPCFRSEAGSYGADVRGLIRQHQFDKVELVKITLAEQSYDELESLTRNAETVLERLGLPYRTVVLCTGDMGFASAKTYDIEVWLPSQQTYREISSCSNTEAFQARRANIRARREGMSKTEYVHTLNGSGLAIGRTLIAILENYQQADGSVIVPEALRPYMRGLEVIAR